MTAEDVVASLERLFDPEVAGANTGYLSLITGGAAFTQSRLQEARTAGERPVQRQGRWIEPLNVSGLRALDQFTVEIQVDQPDLSFLKQLATAPCGIIDSQEARQNPRAFQQRPVGPGPYRIAEWTRGIRLCLERNPHRSPRDEHLPSGVEIQIVADPTLQTMMFERGELDLVSIIAEPDLWRIRKSPDHHSRLQGIRGSGPLYVFLNCEVFPFTNRMVRIALNHAVDKSMLARVLGYQCTITPGPVPLVVADRARDLPDYPHDPAKARALLREAGLPDGFASTLWVPRYGAAFYKVALFLQQSLLEVGVRLEIRETSGAAFLDLAGRRRAIPMGIGQYSSAINDPKETLEFLFNGDRITDENCPNWAFYSNPLVQHLHREAVAESDPVRRSILYQRIERQVVDDAPWIFLAQSDVQVLIQPWLKGVQITGFCPAIRLDRCWLDR